MAKKFHIIFDGNERRLIIESLNNLRNHLLSEGKYTDAVDEVLVKIMRAKQKTYRVEYKEDLQCRNILTIHKRE